MHLVVSLGLILAVDKYLKAAFVAAAIKFPSALFGMFCTFSILLVLDSTVPVAATALENFFEPALLFIQRWLPLFYVPSLVVLPLAVQDIPAASGVKILFIIGISIILINPQKHAQNSNVLPLSVVKCTFSRMPGTFDCICECDITVGELSSPQ